MKIKSSFVLVENLNRNEENLSSSGENLSDKQHEMFFNHTTNFLHQQTPKKYQHVSLYIDESSIKKRHGSSIRSMNFARGDSLGSNDRRSMTLTPTELKRLKNDDLSQFRHDTEE
jgi:hypothetical protein